MAENDANVVLTANTLQYQQAMASAEKSTTGVMASVTALSLALSNLATKTGKGISIVGVGQSAALLAMAKAAGDLEAQMSKLRATSAITDKTFDVTAKGVQDLRRSFAVSREEAIQLNIQLTKLGQQNTSLRDLSDTFLRLSAVSGEGVSGLVDGLITLQRQMGTQGAEYTKRFAANLAVVSEKAGVSATSVLQFANAIAPIGKVAGLTTNEIMGVSTAFTKAGADGYYAANAFNKMLIDITRSITYGSPELRAYSNLIGVSVEKFRSMPKAEAVTRIFEEINAQGPEAIKTLERFGLDGIRVYRALQAVASAGGIRQTVADTLPSKENLDSFQDASDKAMSGLNDSMAKLRNTAATTAEAMGKGVAPAVKALADGTNFLLKPLSRLLELLGNIPGIAGMAGAGITMLGGAALMALPKLIGLGTTWAMINSTFGRGIQAGWTGRPNAATASYLATDEFGRPTAGMAQRAGYAAGAGIGGAGSFLRNLMFPVEAGGGGGGRLGRIAAAPFHGLTALATYGLEPLFRMGADPFARGALIPSRASAGDWLQRQYREVGEAWTRMRTRADARAAFRNLPLEAVTGGVGAVKATPDLQRLATSSNVAAEANERLGKSSGFLSTAFHGFGRDLASLLGATGKAGLGTVAGVGAGVGRLAMGATSALVGAIGLPTIGIIGATMAYDAYKREKEVSEKLATQGGEDTSAGSKYRQALGEATQSVMTFADALKTTTNETLNMGQAQRVTSDDLDKAQKSASDYTDKSIATMTKQQATAFASAAMVGASPQDIQLLKMDLLKRFGDLKTVQDIMRKAVGEPAQVGPLFEQITAAQGTFMGIPRDLRTTEEAVAAAETARGTLARAISQAAPGPERIGVMVAGFNQAVQAAVKSNNQLTVGTITDALTGALGQGDEESRKAIYDVVTKIRAREVGPAAPGRAGAAGLTVKGPGGAEIDMSKIGPAALEELAKSKTPIGATARGILEQAKNNRISLATMTLPEAPTATGGIATGRYAETTAQATLAGQMVLGRPVPTTAEERAAQTIQAQWGGGANPLLAYAYRNEADVNAQFKATEAWTSELVASTGSIDGAIKAFQDLQNSGIAASDRLYQMAAAGEAYARQQQQRAMYYMSTPERAEITAANYARSRAILNANPKDQAASERFQKDEEAYIKARNDLYDKAIQFLYAERELEVSNNRAREDNARQQRYALVDFNRQRAWAQQDFQIQRRRGEEEFNRQRKYAEADYNRNRLWSIQAFNRQRLRNEQDYQHQILVMNEQTAKQIYDIYARVNVAQTWSAGALYVNMQDQQRRLTEQVANLQRLRGLGISGDVISMLGLNEAENAQQLARFLDDVMNDPALVKKYNELAAARTKATAKIVQDEDNLAWQEMKRQHDLALTRSIQDFQISLNQQAVVFKEGLRRNREAYNISVNQAEEDFARARARQVVEFTETMRRMNEALNLQIRRGHQDLVRSATEISGTWGDITQRMIDHLSGTAKKAMTKTREALKTSADDTKAAGRTLVSDLKSLFAQIGISIMPGNPGQTAAGGRIITGRIMVNGVPTNIGQVAEGGEITGFSPHSRADNQLRLLTAGEFVQPVDSVRYYGKDLMEAMRVRKIAREEIAGGLASGGLVDYGHWLQGRHYSVSEHPAFGGVTPGAHVANSWHYKSGAIDVNADNFREGEKAAIDRIWKYARTYGLRTIWWYPNHYNHAHFDIGAGSDLVGPGYAATSGPGGNEFSAPYTGYSFRELNEMVKKLPGVKAFNKAMAKWKIMDDAYGGSYIAALIAARYAGQGIGGSGDLGPLKTMLANQASRRGWTGSQLAALDWIITRESSWNPNAQNPNSTAYGLFQFLDSTWGTVGGEKTSDPAKQIELGLKYIAMRYGTPLAAKSFWQAHGWYGDGSIFNKPTNIGVAEHGPEAVFPLNEKGVAFLTALIRKYTGYDEYSRAASSGQSIPVTSKQVAYYSQVDKSNKFYGDIAVAANDPNELIRKLEAKQRMGNLTGARR